MATNIISYVVTATKQASGNVRFDIYSSNDGVNSTGDLRFSFTMTSANVTSMNTTVNGGSTGATLSFGYAENSDAANYPLGYVTVA